MPWTNPIAELLLAGVAVLEEQAGGHGADHAGQAAERLVEAQVGPLMFSRGRAAEQAQLPLGRGRPGE